MSYALAVGIVALASLACWRFPGIFAAAPYLIFYPAVGVAAAVAGFGPGLVATLMAAASVHVLLTEPFGQLNLDDPVQWARTCIFLAGGTAMSIVADMLSNARTRERRQSEELLHSEQRFHSLLIEGARDYAIIMLDAKGNVATWNAGAQRVKGYTAEQIVGRHFSCFYTPQDLAASKPQRQLEKALEHGQYAEEAWRIRQDGSKFWAGVTITPLRDSAAAPCGFAQITRDLTERKSAEDALRQGEQRMRLLVEAVQEYAIVMLDAQGTVVTWNTGAQRIKGYAPAQIIGQNFSCFYTPEDVAAGKPQHELAIVTQRGQYSDEAWRVRQDGSRFWASVKLTAIRDSAGELRGFAKVTCDLTERKRAELQIQHTLELARSNAELQQFAYVASHDLQEPLRAITGCVQLLQQRYQGKLEGRADEFIAHAVEGATRMRALINDLLEYSRVGTRVNAFGPTDCNEVLKAALSNLQTAINEKKAVVTSDLLPTVMADETRLMQLLQNLIGNALKFTGDKPPKIHVGAQRVDGAWQFSVSDNGIGIEAQYRERIFGVFQRLHTRREYPGTGIGLAICKRIVEHHGGRIWVESELGKGAIFHFLILDGAES